jgi:hypothetical protein
MPFPPAINGNSCTQKVARQTANVNVMTQADTNWVTVEIDPANFNPNQPYKFDYFPLHQGAAGNQLAYIYSVSIELDMENSPFRQWECNCRYNPTQDACGEPETNVQNPGLN